MYIKQVIIDGFKSYKDQTITEPFSPKINCVVGANGSGKSNFFHAIRFVLNDAFTSMRAEERQALLHEGAGHAVLSAFVELVFDNSDGRFPIDKDEVRLRRTIGAKKDEYTLDRKHVTKQEVMNLLESAGFSRANPYYIVQQGKIMSMANMRDSERLELLKEIGGTKVYEERRRESLRIMQETENRRAQIEEVVEFIESKLRELDAEKAELAEFQALDRQRRSIEYALFDRELAEARSKAAKLEADRAKLGEESAAAQKEAAAARERLRAVDAAIAAAAESKAAAERARKALAKERDAALKQRARLELDVREAAGKLETDAEASEAARAELGRLSAQISEAEGQAASASAALEERRRREKELAESLSESQARLQALMSKQGRASQFSSQAERDAFLKASRWGPFVSAGEIKKLQEAASKQEKARAALAAQVEEINAGLMAAAQDVGDKEKAAREAAGQLEALSRQLAELRKARDEARLTGAADKRKEAWRGADDLADQYRAAEAEHARAREAAQRVIPRDISQGIMSMEAARRALNIKGVYGSLADLLEVPPQLATAVEVVCGNQAFQVVVDSTDIGMRLVAELNRQRSGRVTFMPLDALRVQEVAYPTEWGEAAVPMHKVLKFEPKFRAAVMQVFGKTMVCQSREVAEKVAASGQLDAITLDGDLVRRKGTVSGGFSDPGRNKIGSHQKVKALERRLSELAAQKKTHEAAAAAADQAVTKLSTEVAQLEGKHKAAAAALDQARREARGAAGGGASQERGLGKAEERLAAAEESLADLARRLAAAREELSTDMLAQASGDLHRALSGVQSSLSRYGHVNRKALDQYVNFTEQREELHRRRDEVLQGEEKIRELISALDMRKDEAIERTFKGVAKNFREVFAALAPGGRGELVMQRRHQAAPGEEDDDDGGAEAAAGGGGAIGKYSGVRVYGVTHSNRISQIDVITRDDALTFLQIEEDAAAAAAGGAGAGAAAGQGARGAASASAGARARSGATASASAGAAARRGGGGKERSDARGGGGDGAAESDQAGGSEEEEEGEQEAAGGGGSGSEDGSDGGAAGGGKRARKPATKRSRR
ncbi:hypothetical protein Rsub_10568 [Raphidocelis subcapitata]|uniref:SMC hinge domain-containing protein n=1 Tax=Raphidocelis subcapitata TaxID=307507 RepID=A0A2V0PE93_9CHLO|nr:hypothetical protein Rsub_10568 [Raphidocelis subcapitata]|eukprot:GBF98156.1 hypothetical protein Rsub_10568 [Raphidocelis subcapitata]